MVNFFKNKFLNRENIKYIAVLVVIFLGVVIVCSIENMNSENRGIIINKIPMLEKLDKSKIGVYIDGEVNKVGYIKIAKGSTLEDAINKAKGVTVDADIQNIDLKRTLKNQEKIIIPRVKEKFVEEDIYSENNIEKININIATKEELLCLEGIGEKTAENIIQYRNNNIFDTIEEIMEVKGIGEGKFDKIKENICI